MYNIIYSITVHENPLVVFDLIQNIQYFNRTMKICIILNGSPSIQYAIECLEGDNVKIIPDPKPRKTAFDLLNAHIENSIYAIKHNIVSRYFVLLASNCLFWRNITFEEIEAKYSSSPPELFEDPPNYQGWGWDNVFKNKNIINILNEDGIKHFYAFQHEGSIYPYSCWLSIGRYITERRLSDIHKDVREKTYILVFCFLGIIRSHTEYFADRRM